MPDCVGPGAEIAVDVEVGVDEMGELVLVVVELSPPDGEPPPVLLPDV